MKRAACIALLTILVAYCAGAAEITVLHTGHLLAVPGNDPLERQSVIIENGFVTEANSPLADISELMRVNFVMRDGVVYRLGNNKLTGGELTGNGAMVLKADAGGFSP